MIIAVQNYARIPQRKRLSGGDPDATEMEIIKYICLSSIVFVIISCNRSNTETTTICTKRDYYVRQVSLTNKDLICSLGISTDKDFKTVLSDSFPELKNLRKLTISSEYPDTFSLIRIFQKYSYIDTLFLYSNNFGIPSSLFSICPYIKYLHLNAKCEIGFPVDFTAATKIEVLICESNNVIGRWYELMSKEAQIKILRELEICDSIALDNLLIQLEGTTTLTNLGIRSFHFRTLPKSIYELNSIESLNLEYNEINNFDCSFTKMKKLRHLKTDRIPNINYPKCLDGLMNISN